MNIQENVCLAHHTTFKIGGLARFFCSVTCDEDVMQAITFAQEKKLRFFILGGGSNVLISDAGFEGLVIKNEYRGITIDGIYVRSAAGEMWDELVDLTVSRGLRGLENLSAIPGTVGAAPVQNISAYGAEISTVIRSVRVFDTKKMKFLELTPRKCRFSYRDSVFKHKKGRYVITHVDFELSYDVPLNTSYKDVQEYFAAQGVLSPTLQEVRRAVIDIRWGKLPDWKLWGTAGSFFKNPIVSARTFRKLKSKFPDLPGFEEGGKVKVSLAWILDRVCNARSLCVGKACMYEKHALVLVAKEGATAKEVVELSNLLMNEVKKKTGITIEAEVEWVN